MKLDYLVMLHTRINSKWIKHLNVRPKTIKILAENIGSKISDIANSTILSCISPKSRETNEKKMGLHHTKFFLHRKAQKNKTTTHWMGTYS